MLSSSVPVKTVKIGPKDSEFITPLVKMLPRIPMQKSHFLRYQRHFRQISKITVLLKSANFYASDGYRYIKQILEFKTFGGLVVSRYL